MREPDETYLDIEEVVCSVDYDAAISPGKDGDALKIEEIVEDVGNKLRQYPNANIRLMVGSYRQSQELDAWHWAYNKNGSAFLALSALLTALKKKYPKEADRIEIHPFLLGDIVNQVDAGATFKQAHRLLQTGLYEEIKARYLAKVDLKAHPAHYIPWHDGQKKAMLYAQMHHVATAFSGKKISFHFYDDGITRILFPLHRFYRENPLLIPRTINLHLHCYEKGILMSSSNNLYPRLSGRGLLDFDYAHNVEGVANPKLPARIFSSSLRQMSLKELVPLIHQDNKELASLSAQLVQALGWQVVWDLLQDEGLGIKHREKFAGYLFQEAIKSGKYTEQQRLLTLVTRTDLRTAKQLAIQEGMWEAVALCGEIDTKDLFSHMLIPADIDGVNYLFEHGLDGCWALRHALEHQAWAMAAHLVDKVTRWDDFSALLTILVLTLERQQFGLVEEIISSHVDVPEEFKNQCLQWRLFFSELKKTQVCDKSQFIRMFEKLLREIQSRDCDCSQLMALLRLVEYLPGDALSASQAKLLLTQLQVSFLGASLGEAGLLLCMVEQVLKVASVGQLSETAHPLHQTAARMVEKRLSKVRSRQKKRSELIISLGSLHAALGALVDMSVRETVQQWREAPSIVPDKSNEGILKGLTAGCGCGFFEPESDEVFVAKLEKQALKKLGEVDRRSYLEKWQSSFTCLYFT